MKSSRKNFSHKDRRKKHERYKELVINHFASNYFSFLQNPQNLMHVEAVGGKFRWLDGPKIKLVSFPLSKHCSK